MTLWLLALYAALYIFISLINYRLAICWFILFLPAYLLRFQIGPLPTTLLEINFLILFFTWSIKYARVDLPKIFLWIKNNKKISIAIFLFLLAATISIFVGNNTYKDPAAALLRGLGIWRAYFIEPAILFFILLGRAQEQKTPDFKNFVSKKFLIQSLILSTVSVSLLAIIQKFIPNLINPELWDDNFYGRVTSFFTSPNAIGLFVAPIIPLMATMFFRSNKKREKAFLITTILLGLVAIILSFSEGAWVALAAGAMVFALMMGWKKFVTALAIGGIIFFVAIPKLQQAMLFQDKAGQNRLALWSYTIHFVTDSPQNFIFGAGLRKFFHSVQQPNYDPTKLERLNYPHNFFLNFWSETGFIGMISFVGILFFAITKILKERKTDILLAAGLLSVVAVIAVHGIVDVPYFKNDLAMIFLLLMAVIL